MSSRQVGTLVQWNDERGFGFIQPDGGGPDVFFHISSFAGRGRPSEGMDVTFAVAEDQERGSHAVSVRPPRDPAQQFEGAFIALGPGVFYFVAMAIYAHFYGIPWWLPAGYFVMSLIAYAVYWSDKDKAQRGAWRTQEATLHWLAVLGGWPGALVAQWHLRHKNRKLSFQVSFWTTVFMNVTVTLYCFLPEWGRPIMRMLSQLAKHATSP